MIWATAPKPRHVEPFHASSGFRASVVEIKVTVAHAAQDASSIRLFAVRLGRACLRNARSPRHTAPARSTAISFGVTSSKNKIPGAMMTGIITVAQRTVTLIR